MDQYRNGLRSFQDFMNWEFETLDSKTTSSSTSQTLERRNAEMGSTTLDRAISSECFQGFAISRVGTPCLPTPGLSTTRVPKYQNLPDHSPLFWISEFAIPNSAVEVLVLRSPKPRNAKMSKWFLPLDSYSKGMSRFMTSGSSMQSAPAPCHRDF
jgi:hypothetical protein